MPWYILPPTEEERRRYNRDPFTGIPEHLRPQFLESEYEIKARIQRDRLSFLGKDACFNDGCPQCIVVRGEPCYFVRKGGAQ